MLLSAAYQTESLVFHTSPQRGRFLLSRSLGPEMTSQMVPGPSSLLLVTDTVSYPAVSFMWLAQKTGKIWLMIILQMCSALTTVPWPVCSYLPQAAACWDAFCLSSRCPCSPCHLAEKIPWEASIWICLSAEPLCPPPLPTLTPPTGKATLCAHQQILTVQYAGGRKELRRVLKMLLYSP